MKTAAKALRFYAGFYGLDMAALASICVPDVPCPLGTDACFMLDSIACGHILAYGPNQAAYAAANFWLSAKASAGGTAVTSEQLAMGRAACDAYRTAMAAKPGLAPGVRDAILAAFDGELRSKYRATFGRRPEDMLEQQKQAVIDAVRSALAGYGANPDTTDPDILSAVMGDPASGIIDALKRERSLREHIRNYIPIGKSAMAALLEQED